ncbi:MAG: leucyl aminopeptidase family protein [Planctomycetota bacterium]
MALPKIETIGDPSSIGDRFDALVIVSTDPGRHTDSRIERLLQQRAAIDSAFSDQVSLLAEDGIPGQRLVVSPTGPLLRDQDDVRRFAAAARAGLRRAREAGARRPTLWIDPAPVEPRHALSVPVAVLGALFEVWQPLEAREALEEHIVEPLESIGIVGDEVERWAPIIEAIESGRRLARDLGGTDPERMAPPRFAEACQEAFAGTGVRVEVVSDVGTLLKDYPILSAVARASLPVERHRPRVIRLEYRPEGPVERTLLLAGKGVTYDTGGADIKAGGHMAGMSRDKCGAAAVAGFLKTVSALAPRGLRVVAEIGAVRNSVGADAYVSDEILVSHAGTRVRIGNTDAEGRLVLADLLSHLREQALEAESPSLFSIATLTGHSVRAVGQYSIAVENGPARRQGIARRLEEMGDAWGDPFDPSRLRPEDWDFIKPRSRADDVLSCNNLPSSATPRGHQFPTAFLIIASGLHRNGGDSDQPLPYTHLDIGGSALEGSDWQHGRPTGAPIPALTASFVLED